MAVGAGMMTSSMLVVMMTTLWIQVQCQFQKCGQNFSIGAEVENRTHFSARESERYFLAMDAGYIDCPGVVKGWTLYANEDSDSDCHAMVFQLWRPSVDGSYVLVGEHRDIFRNDLCYPLGGVGKWDVVIPENQQMAVMPGDVFGWMDVDFFYEDLFNYTDRLLLYDEFDLSGSARYGQVSILDEDQCTPRVGHSCPWTGSPAYFSSSVGARKTVRDYSLQILLDQDVNPPVIINLGNAKNQTVVDVTERQPAGHVVYTVSAMYNYTWNPVLPPAITYQIRDYGNCPKSWFTVDPSSGVITTTSELVYSPLSFCVLIIIAGIEPNCDSDGGYLRININNINDPHVMKGLPNSVDIDLTDDLPGSTAVANMSVEEVDDPPQSNYTWFILRADPAFPRPPFEIRDTTPQTAEVWLTPDISDQMAPLSYRMWIAVTDGEFMAGPELLTVNLLNPRQPAVLANLPTVISVREDYVGALFNVTIDDRIPAGDTRGDPVKYCIKRWYPAIGEKHFEIHKESGIVTVLPGSGIDYLEQGEYKMEIIATDDDPLFSSPPANLTVHITWVNTPPTFQSSALSRQNTSIDELVPLNTVLHGVDISATDRDIVLGDWFDFIISDQTGELNAHLFRADNQTGSLYTNGQLRVPTKQPQLDVILTVSVFDSFAQKGLENVTIEVTIMDVNDHAPEFDSTLYTGSVCETDRGGVTTGVVVNATDNDGPIYNKVTYRIQETQARLYFQVEVSGEVLLKQPISYAQYPNLTFTVVAEDSGSPPLSDTTTVTIYVNETNTHRPVFQPVFYNLELRSDVSVNSFVEVVRALDLDTDAVNSVEYYFIVLQDDFSINSSSGEVFVRRPLQPYRRYLLYVNARDNGIREFFSDPAIIRVDTFPPDGELVEVELLMPMTSFLPLQQDFAAQLSDLLSPWRVRIHDIHLYQDRTIVTVYAVEDDATETEDVVNNLLLEKHFVGRSRLVERLRTDLYGNLRYSVRKSPFAVYQPVKAWPTNQNWWTETPEGIGVLTLLCVLAALLILLSLLLLCKRKGWLCFDKRPKPASVKPVKQAPPVGEEEQYNLKYKTGSKPKNTTDQYKLYSAGPLIPGQTENDFQIYGKPSEDKGPSSKRSPPYKSPNPQMRVSPPPAYASRNEDLPPVEVTRKPPKHQANDKFMESEA